MYWTVIGGGNQHEEAVDDDHLRSLSEVEACISERDEGQSVILNMGIVQLANLKEHR